MKRDRAYLKHIIEATSNIEKFIEDLTKEGFFRECREACRLKRA
jgi:uncharacterized protein with HEPN domain